MRALGSHSIKLFPFSRIIRSTVREVCFLITLQEGKLDWDNTKTMITEKDEPNKQTTYDHLLKYYGEAYMKNIIRIHLNNLSTYENLQKVVDLK